MEEVSNIAQAQVPQGSAKSGSSKKLWTVIIVVLLLIALSVAGIVVYRIMRPGKPILGIGGGKTELGTPSVDLPVSLKNPAVKSSRINYLFQVAIAEIKTTSNGLTEIVTTLDSVNKPQFILDSETPIFIREGTTEQEASPSALSVGQNVDISIYYRLKEKTWNNVSRVTINQSNSLPQGQ